MRKGIITSLMVSTVLSTVVCADSLKEAFKNSKVTGEIKAQYFNTSPVTDGKSDSISAIGGNLNLVTGSFYGLKAGVTFQTSHVLDIDTENANDFSKTMDASGSVMSESYLEYGIKNTMLRVGRQYIDLPLISGSPSRMIKESFEAYTLQNKDIPDTSIIGTYVTKYQGRTDEDGDPGKFDSYEDGAYSIYAKNKSIKNLELQLQYLDVNAEASNTDKDVIYMDVNYQFPLVKVGAQFIKSTNRNEDGQMIGLKASGNVSVVNLTALYTTTNGDGTVFSGIGADLDTAFTALPLHGGGVTYTKDTDTIVGVAATKILGATIVAYYGQVNTDAKTGPLMYDKIDAIGGFIQYPFTKDFSAKIMYESADFNSAEHDDNMLRIYTSYKF